MHAELLLILIICKCTNKKIIRNTQTPKMAVLQQWNHSLDLCWGVFGLNCELALCERLLKSFSSENKSRVLLFSLCLATLMSVLMKSWRTSSVLRLFLTPRRETSVAPVITDSLISLIKIISALKSNFMWMVWLQS